MAEIASGVLAARVPSCAYQTAPVGVAYPPGVIALRRLIDHGSPVLARRACRPLRRDGLVAPFFPQSVSQSDWLRCLTDYDRWRLDASVELEVRHATIVFCGIRLVASKLARNWRPAPRDAFVDWLSQSTHHVRTRSRNAQRLKLRNVGEHP
jgi:hypothetical protein